MPGLRGAETAEWMGLGALPFLQRPPVAIRSGGRRLNKNMEWANGCQEHWVARIFKIGLSPIGTWNKGTFPPKG